MPNFNATFFEWVTSASRIVPRRSLPVRVLLGDQNSFDCREVRSVFGAGWRGAVRPLKPPEKSGADVRALELLLNALVAIRLLTKTGDVYTNTPVATTHLVKHSPQYVGHLLLLHDAEWGNWGKLEAAVTTGRSPVTQHVFETDPALGANVLSVLHRIGQQSGPDLAKRLALGHARTMLDLGGGAGTNAIAFCQVYPQLSATVFDLPTTLPLTETDGEGGRFRGEDCAQIR